MIPPELLIWFAAALLVAGIVFIVGWQLIKPPVSHFSPQREFERFKPPTPYTGRHRVPDEEEESYDGYHPIAP